jgi:hypothetical protein
VATAELGRRHRCDRRVDDGITFDDLADSRGLYQFRRPYTAPDDGGTYRAIWTYGCEQVHETVVVADSSEARFAEPTTWRPGSAAS